MLLRLIRFFGGGGGCFIFGGGFLMMGGGSFGFMGIEFNLIILWINLRMMVLMDFIFKSDMLLIDLFIGLKLYVNSIRMMLMVFGLFFLFVSSYVFL